MNHDYGRAQYLPTGKQTTGHWVLYENQYCIHFPFIEHKFSISKMLVSNAGINQLYASHQTANTTENNNVFHYRRIFSVQDISLASI